MKKILNYTIYCIALSCFLATHAKALGNKELEAKINALVPAEINDSTPGLVIGIVHKDKLIFSKGYGMANISYGMPNDPKMVYNTGSVSKQFLGYAFAMLHVDGKLNLDDPVGKYMQDWPEFKHKVTLRHLLSHTSGYREAYTMSNLAGRIVGVDHLSRKECLDVVRNQPELEFIPGSRYTYNSTAWVILAEVLEKVTGQPADKWVEDNILKPLDMKDTQIESYVGDVIINTAESYSYDEKQGFKNEESNRAIFGAAEVYSNIDDMVKWIKNFKTAEIGGQNVNTLFLKPFMLNDGTNSDYALGIKNESYRGLKRYRHTGGHEAFLTQLSYYPEQDLGIYTVTNYGGKGWIDTSKIAEILLEKHMIPSIKTAREQIDVKQEKLEQLKGLYVAETLNRTLDLNTEEGKLVQGETKLIATASNTFYLDGRDVKYQFKNTPNQTQLTITDGAKYSYFKAEKWTPNEVDLNIFKGNYWSDELETVYHLIIKDKNLTIKHRWLGEIALMPAAKDFFTTEWGFYVKFNRNKKGEVINLSVYSGRTLNVIFQKKPLQ